jgi:hypothetical protein
VSAAEAHVGRSTRVDATVPTDEEMAAISAAVEVLWPRPGTAAPVAKPPRWRFSGRWWTRPLVSRRIRP